ncbi:hypothetical protein ACJ5NV_00395 [Loktanella agnita]|uniref:hypothetical protein n=1 Tax=Loktanella agnita TaxID=287097 RepID=UPI003987365B
MMTYFVKAIAAALLTGLSGPLPALAQSAVDPNVQHVLDHINAHGVSVVRTSDGGAMVILETDFATRGLPELRVSLGRDGVFMPDTDLGTLRKITGLQVFTAPSSINIEEYDTLFIWDPRAATPVGLAPLG